MFYSLLDSGADCHDQDCSAPVSLPGGSTSAACTTGPGNVCVADTDPASGAQHTAVREGSRIPEVPSAVVAHEGPNTVDLELQQGAQGPVARVSTSKRARDDSHVEDLTLRAVVEAAKKASDTRSVHGVECHFYGSCNEDMHDSRFDFLLDSGLDRRATSCLQLEVRKQSASVPAPKNKSAKVTVARSLHEKPAKDTLFTLEEVYQHWGSGNKMSFLVKYVGFEDVSWQPISNFVFAEEINDVTLAYLRKHSLFRVACLSEKHFEDCVS